MDTNLRQPQPLFAHPIRYEIPAFQRRYVWKQEEQWEPLWEDIERLADSTVEGERPAAHFMGAIVLQQMEFPTGTMQRRLVVDGQQRLTTLQLLMDAIQEVLEFRGHSNPAKRLSALVLNGEEFWDGKPDRAFKVWPTVIDRVAFQHAMSNDLSATEHTTSRIVQAHDYFKGQAIQWLDKFPDENGERDRAANALEAAVSVKLEIVVIDLGDSENPHVIFETLNARGTPLLQSDMVKNKVLHEAGIKLEDDEGDATSEMKRIWPFDQDEWWAQDIGRGLQRRPRIDVYLNHWLTIRNLSETKPYNEFRIFDVYAGAQTASGDSIEAVAEDLGALGSIYRDVEEFRRNDIALFLRRRNVMNVGVVTPLLLWLLSADLAPLNLANCLGALESFLVRRVVCGYSARGYGGLFVGLIAKLAEASPEFASRIIVSYLGEQTAQAALWPSDRELFERFITAPLYQYLTRGRLAMLLEGVEQELRTNKAESTVVPAGLQIEHVMPQAWHENWPLAEDINDRQDATENRNQLIHTIGNLTLVNDRLNPALSNAPWRDKRKALARHSVLYLNKSLVNEGPEHWDEAVIEERSKWLHKRAIRIWPHADDL